MADACVRAHMAIGRDVAAERGAARLADAQVHPGALDLHALIALAAFRLLDLGYRVDMGARLVGHGRILPRQNRTVGVCVRTYADAAVLRTRRDRTVPDVPRAQPVPG